MNEWAAIHAACQPDLSFFISIYIRRAAFINLKFEEASILPYLLGSDRRITRSICEVRGSEKSPRSEGPINFNARGRAVENRERSLQ